MNELFLIILLVLIIAIAGDNINVRSICALAILLIVISYRMKQVEKPATENYTVVDDKPPRKIDFADYSNFAVFDPEIRLQDNATFTPKLRMLNDRTALQEIQRGTQAAQIHRGMQKNRVNYMRPFFEEEMRINDNLDWWNEDRIFGDCY